MNLSAILPIEPRRKIANVIIETPKGSQYKFVYDEGLQLFKVKKILPAGLSFPLDFGFLPNTKAGDGDPLDVLVMADEPLFAGCLVACRLLGVLEAVQKEKGKTSIRNDRFIAVAESSVKYNALSSIKDLGKTLRHQLESFMVYYNHQEGKIFTPGKWRDARVAMQLAATSIII